MNLVDTTLKWMLESTMKWMLESTIIKVENFNQGEDIFQTYLKALVNVYQRYSTFIVARVFNTSNSVVPQ